MIIKTAVGDQPNVQITVNEPPKLFGVPMTKIILFYHVLFILLQFKWAFYDGIVPSVLCSILATITVISYILMESHQKTYIKIHFWICLVVPICMILTMLCAVFYEYITGNQSFLEGFSSDRDSDIITAFIVLNLLGVYIWVCYKFSEHLSRIPEILPRHSQDVVHHVQLTTRY
ncbi:hypothetical protein L5515_004748 [Caenorhabditis briggsae]|uniref:Uncharacterized protein n=1 Tax=Caenorhabditis briggsae TaxID=6238 RepID=A0AAE9EPS6_CAEBR|nr:hypothetical protein L5515_004748 [Caenorhabditis briggsae]